MQRNKCNGNKNHAMENIMPIVYNVTQSSTAKLWTNTHLSTHKNLADSVPARLEEHKRGKGMATE